MSELRDGREPEAIKDLSVDLRKHQQSAIARIFDPWQDRWTDSALSQGRLSLPEFTRSVVVRLTK
jgi:hypothetical protein